MKRDWDAGCWAVFMGLHGVAEAEPAKSPRAVIEMATGKIVVELYEKDAPGTVANFFKLAKQGYYNGLSFHRVVPGFVAQGDDPNGDGI